MENQLYQMKDLMEKFGVTRDTIKYYEKKGLIKPIRNGSGYRLYDETQVQKLKMIMDLKNMGFSLEKVETQLSGEQSEGAIEEIEKIKKETEKTIEILTSRLKKLETYEEWLVGNKIQEEEFKAEEDFQICSECYKVTQKYSENFFVRDMMIVHLSDRNRIKSVEEKMIVLANDAVKIREACAKCTRDQKIMFPKVFSGNWCGKSKGDLEKFLSRMYAKADQLGYRLCRNVYCIKKMGEVDGRECIAYTIKIPFQ